MVPEPSRTSANEHHPTPPTCGISTNRRSARDRNNLDTVVVITESEAPILPPLITAGQRSMQPLAAIRTGGRIR
jgi:hypothetical protein